MLTAAGLGQLHEAKRSVVCRHGLEGNVAVPPGSPLLLGTQLVLLRLAVELLVLDRADRADLGVVAAAFALRVQQRVDVQSRGGGTTSQLSEADDELLLQFVGEVVLGAEEDDAALGDCRMVSCLSSSA